MARGRGGVLTVAASFAFLHVDQAAGPVRILRHEVGEARIWIDALEQTARYPAVERAYRGLVGSDGVAVGAVAQHEAMPSFGRVLAAWGEPEPRQCVLHRVTDRPAAGRRKLVADLPPDLLDLSKTWRPRERTSEPAGKPRITLRRLEAWSSVR